MSWFAKLKSPRGRSSHKPLAFEVDGSGNDPAPAPAAVVRTARAPRKAKGGGWLPAFRTTASDQPRPVENVVFAEARLRLRNAYTPSHPVVDAAMFAGRSQVLATLIRAIEDERLHAIVYGERGIGKTSLLHVVAQAARDARYLVTYISCGAASDFDQAFRVVARDISLIFHAGYGPSSPEGERGETIGDLLPAAPISVQQASDHLARVVGTRVLLVLDEFDRAESPRFRRDVAELIKNLSDRAVRVQVLIGGVAGNLTELLAQVPSIQRNIFAMPIPRMSEGEVRDLVRLGEDRSDLQFEEAARRFIVTAANGLPYLASLLSHHAGLEAIEKSRLDVTRADVAAAVSEALNEQRSRLSKRSQLEISRCVQQGQTTVLGGLSNLAQLSGGAFSIDDLASAWPGPEGVAQTHGLVKQLTASGLLLECRDDDFGLVYRFAEDCVPIYLWLLAAQARFPNGESLEGRELDRSVSAAI